MRDARNARRSEEEWLAQNARQQCVVCKLWFIKRAEKVCSRECAARLEQAKQQKA